MSSRPKPVLSTEPHDRLTAICAELTERLDLPGREDIRAVIMLHDTEMGGLVIHGYEEGGPSDAMTDIFLHIAAVFEAQGKQLILMDEEGFNVLGGDRG